MTRPRQPGSAAMYATGTAVPIESGMMSAMAPHAGSGLPGYNPFNASQLMLSQAGPAGRIGSAALLDSTLSQLVTTGPLVAKCASFRRFEL